MVVNIPDSFDQKSRNEQKVKKRAETVVSYWFIGTSEVDIPHFLLVSVINV